MSNTAKSKPAQSLVPYQSLDEAVAEIHRNFASIIKSDNRAHQLRIATGMMLLALRGRIEAGEAGEGVKWWDWYKTKFVRSRRDAEKIIKIANAANPEEAAEEAAEQNRQAQARHRAKRNAAYVSRKPGDKAKDDGKVEFLFSACGMPLNDAARGAVAAGKTVDDIFGASNAEKLFGSRQEDMPTEAEADESWQNDLYDQVCLLLERMTGPTRQRVFAHIRMKYLPEAIGPADDDLSIPPELRREAAE